MKKIFKSITIAVVISIAFAMLPFFGECREISDKVFRIHILANSDSKEDQNLKLSVRDSIISYSEELLKDSHSKEDAMRTVCENLNSFADVAMCTIREKGYSYPVKVSVDNIYFSTRYYEDITMPAGYYDALRVEIGKAEGKNWWCVMYPSLCLYSEEKSDSLKDNLTDRQYGIVSSDGNFEFRFKLLELFMKLFGN